MHLLKRRCIFFEIIRYIHHMEEEGLHEILSKDISGGGNANICLASADEFTSNGSNYGSRRSGNNECQIYLRNLDH